MNKITCVNDSNRPNCIPIHKWVKKGEKYTPIGLLKCNVQGGIMGVILEEIELDSSCEPYKCFALSRFAIPIPEKQLEEELELVEY